ncbi:MAG: hydrogenase formation protein HypD [Methanomassiliicoccales archaeon]|nr:hydrogenase formation protein HypD [Methanomassiliicoccales archaeon]
MFRFRDESTAREILDKIRKLDVDLRFMHVCGTHQDTLVRFGLQELLREAGVEIRQGPGCPVCVTTSREINEAIALVDSGVTLAVFGDMVAVPTPRGSLADAKARGGDVRVVYSIEDAIRLAKDRRRVVFLAIGFETTSPTTASALADGVPDSFSVLSCHRLLPPALDTLFEMGEVRIDGLIEPGHVSTIIGVEPYRGISEKWHIPQVVAGFEPLDVLVAVYMLVRQAVEGRTDVENEYTRVVKPEGNPRAVALLKRVFTPVDKAWRGLPVIKKSALELSEEFQLQNARLRFSEVLSDLSGIQDELKGCRCGEVLRGLIASEECPAFGTACSPRSPMGPCMVSREGSCNISYRYRMRTSAR